MNRLRRLGQKASERREYASKEEVASVFESEQAVLQRLALLLTADSETAKRCLIRTFRECIASSSVSKQWVLSWTRRILIHNAISLVMGLGGQPFVNANVDLDNGLVAFSPEDSPGPTSLSKSILDLPEFDRFVFVICVLEGYSMHDCALLLGKSPRDISEARQRVRNQVGQINELRDISQCFAMR